MPDHAIATRQFLDILEAKKIPPPPPEHLQRRIAGGYYEDFMSSGVRSEEAFNAALKTVDRQINDAKHILDFGAGCWRVLRWFAERYNRNDLTGIDIDPEAIVWMNKNYTQFGTFHVIPHMPPTALPAGHFDLIYGISVFTHLPLDMQFAWLSELRRIASNDAYILLTVRDVPPTASDKLKDEIAANGFAYVDGGATHGLPDFYRTTYHSRSYIEREWSKYFKVIQFFPGAMDWGQQDLVLLSR